MGPAASSGGEGLVVSGVREARRKEVARAGDAAAIHPVVHQRLAPALHAKIAEISGESAKSG